MVWLLMGVLTVCSQLPRNGTARCTVYLRYNSVTAQDMTIWELSYTRMPEQYCCSEWRYLKCRSLRIQEKVQFWNLFLPFVQNWLDLLPFRTDWNVYLFTYSSFRCDWKFSLAVVPFIVDWLLPKHTVYYKNFCHDAVQWVCGVCFVFMLYWHWDNF